MFLSNIFQNCILKMSWCHDVDAEQGYHLKQETVKIIVS